MKIPLGTGQIVAVAAYCFILSSCLSKTATIYKKNGEVIEVEITRSDVSLIYFMGCHTAEQHDDEGRTKKVELHCNGDDIPEAIKTYKYNKEGRRTVIEMDLCGDGTIDRRLTLVYYKKQQWTKRIGDKNADDTLDLELARKASCPGKKAGDAYETAVARADIAGIDHPGNVHAMVGTALGVAGLGYGILGVIVSFGEEGIDENNVTFIAAPGLLIGIPAAIIALYGWFYWANSKSLAEEPSEDNGVQAVPMAFSDGDRTYLGGSLIWKW